MHAQWVNEAKYCTTSQNVASALEVHGSVVLYVSGSEWNIVAF
jgi:hypothetical protein